MAFPIIGGSQSGGYLIDNSLRFNDDDSARLTKSFSTGNRDLFTWSCWVKRGNLSANMNLFREDTTFNLLRFNSSNQLEYFNNIDSATIVTNALYRDVSGWYNIQFVYDSGNATASDRLRLYVNGERITSFSSSSYPSLNADSGFNSGVTHSIGARPAGAEPFDGYIAEVHFIDGQALSPTDFGEFDEDSGIWKPIRYSGSYGTNGFYLDFENSGSLGADQSGNGNNFTPTNLASTDQMLDTPTNNFCTLNVLNKRTNPVYSEGNLKVTTSGTFEGICTTTFGLSSGKWYFEYVHLTSDATVFGIVTEDVPINAWQPSSGTDWAALRCLGNFQSNTGSTPTDTSSFNNGDIISGAFDLDTGEIEFFVNGSSVGTITGITTDVVYFPFIADLGSLSGRNLNGVLNLGQDSSFAGNKTRQNNSDSNGKGDFYYAPPSGYLALCTQNLATVLSPTIDDGSAYFHTQLYTGNSTARSITNDANAGDFQPDMLWIKDRTSGNWHNISDTNRGATKVVYPNDTSAEVTNSAYVTSFDTDGFSIGTGNDVNATPNNFVAWQWKANAGSTSSNTDGSITSTVQANTTAGFSIITYTGNSTNSTIGHGLGVAPSFYVTKNRTQGIYGWVTYHQSLGATKGVFLNTTGSQVTDSTLWNNTEPTSSVISLGYNAGTNNNAQNYVMYAFAEIEGYSKFGSYTGNGSTDGPFIYTGFRPSFILTKASSRTEDWAIIDNKRDAYNVNFKFLKPNTSEAENTGVNRCDFTSNGFKWRDTNTKFNQSGETYIYMAFAENPFVSSGAVPVTAR